MRWEFQFSCLLWHFGDFFSRSFPEKTFTFPSHLRPTLGDYPTKERTLICGKRPLEGILLHQLQSVVSLIYRPRREEEIEALEVLILLLAPLFFFFFPFGRNEVIKAESWV